MRWRTRCGRAFAGAVTSYTFTNVQDSQLSIAATFNEYTGTGQVELDGQVYTQSFVTGTQRLHHYWHLQDRVSIPIASAWWVSPAERQRFSQHHQQCDLHPTGGSLPTRSRLSLRLRLGQPERSHLSQRRSGHLSTAQHHRSQPGRSRLPSRLLAKKRSRRNRHG